MGLLAESERREEADAERQAARQPEPAHRGIDAGEIGQGADQKEMLALAEIVAGREQKDGGGEELEAVGAGQRRAAANQSGAGEQRCSPGRRG